MLTMDQIHDIRSRYYNKGENISQIAAALNINWKTVQKYIDMTDFNQPVIASSERNRLCPKLEPFKATIDKWLMEDKNAPRKQRHTAKRVFDRLHEEFPNEFNCSYRTVVTYYGVKKKEVFKGQTQGYLPLDHKPGEAQVDFGIADFYENGRLHTGKYLEVTFPYSNKGYMQLFYGENLECLLEGLERIFKHIGCVPDELWFDNTKTIVTKILRGGARELTDRFKRFREHYMFKAIFTNPNKGNEKGCVENKVGYHRRNLLVPVPRFISLTNYNRDLLVRCEENAEREHYKHNSTINELFENDLKYCHNLPDIPFDTSGRRSITANNWGKFFLYKGMHEYSASPKYANEKVNVKLTSSHVIVLDENFREIVSHSRLYGEKKQQSMDWLPYLKQLSLRPRALKYTGVYELMPDPMKQYLESCSNSETGKVLKILCELTDRTGFDSAMITIEHALTYEASDADSLKNLYRRLYADVPELPPMSLPKGVHRLEQMTAGLDAYDDLLRKGGFSNV